MIRSGIEKDVFIDSRHCLFFVGERVRERIVHHVRIDIRFQGFSEHAFVEIRFLRKENNAKMEKQKKKCNPDISNHSLHNYSKQDTNKQI
jgi:hypothetical protein